jgi:hypothetical protein
MAYLGEEMNETNEYFEYLNALRESGETNMFGAGPYLQKEFGLDKWNARNILFEWMESFSKSKTNTSS